MLLAWLKLLVLEHQRKRCSRCCRRWECCMWMCRLLRHRCCAQNAVLLAQVHQVVACSHDYWVTSPAFQAGKRRLCPGSHLAGGERGVGGNQGCHNRSFLTMKLHDKCLKQLECVGHVYGAGVLQMHAQQQQ